MCEDIASVGTNDGLMVEKGVGSFKDDTDADNQKKNQVQTLVHKVCVDPAMEKASHVVALLAFLNFIC